MSFVNVYDKTDGANNNSIHKHKDDNNQMRKHGSAADDINPGDLCCCEYINSHGERSHLMALFCDCEELDDTVDRFFKGVAIPTSRSHEIMFTIEDR